MIEVIGDDAEFSSSNAQIEWLGAAYRSPLETSWGYAFAVGTIAGRHDRAFASNVAGQPNPRRLIFCKTAVRRCRDSPCDKASPAAFVMLHLRSCYVSKAAILTIPVRPCRSKIEVPLEFQGLGSLGAASWRRFFPLRV